MWSFKVLVQKMVRDRLHELKVGYTSDASGSNTDEIVTVAITPNTTQESIKFTLEKHSKIKQLLDVVKTNTEEMRKQTNDVVKSFYNPKEFSEAMNKKRLDNLSVYQNVTIILKELENDLENPDDCSTVSRMKFGLYHGNKEEIYIVWRDYTNFLIAYEEKIKKIIQRQALIAQHSITEEETEALIENNRSIFTGNILQETESVRNNLKELVERYQELEKIEKSLREVKEMFIYMGTLVHQQGEVIQSIEFHAQLAVSNVDNGAVELEKARDFKIKSLKKKTCILIWVTVILSVLLLIVFVT